MADDLQRDFGKVEGRLHVVEIGLNTIDTRLGRLEIKIDALREDRAKIIGAAWIGRAIAGIVGAGGAGLLLKFSAIFR